MRALWRGNVPEEVKKFESVALGPSLVMLSPSLVILSEAKNLRISLRINSAKQLRFVENKRARFLASLGMTSLADVFTACPALLSGRHGSVKVAVGKNTEGYLSGARGKSPHPSRAGW